EGGVVGRGAAVPRAPVPRWPARILVAGDAGGPDFDHSVRTGRGRIRRCWFASEVPRVGSYFRGWNLRELRLLDLRARERVLLQLLARDGAVLELAPVDLDGGVAGAAERDEEREVGDHSGVVNAEVEPREHCESSQTGLGPSPLATLHRLGRARPVFGIDSLSPAR